MGLSFVGLIVIVLVIVPVLVAVGFGIRRLVPLIGIGIKAFSNKGGPVTLTCMHCQQETTAGVPTCEHCGRNL